MIDDLIDMFDDVAESHHETFNGTGDEDPDWALWYADQLLKMKDFAPLVGGSPDKEVLVKALLTLNNNYLQEGSKDSWEEYFSKHLVDTLKF